MKEYKLGLALTPEFYKELKAKPEGRFLLRSDLKTKIESTPDDDYQIIYGDWITLGDGTCAWEDLLREIECKRHALITISEDGEIWRDIESCDDDGCDEEFEEILGWTAGICLWNDCAQPITDDLFQTDVVDELYEDADLEKAFADILREEMDSDQDRIEIIRLLRAAKSGDMNGVLIALCGWSAPTLLAKARKRLKGGESDD